MNRNAKLQAGLGRALLAATLLAAAVWPGAAALGQANPTTEPVTEEPSQIVTPGGESSSDGPAPADISYFPSPRAMYATTSSRVRAGPGTGHAPVGTIPYAGQVSVLGQSPDSAWLYVEMGDGTRGFTAARLLSDVRPTASSGSTTGSTGSSSSGSSPQSCVAGQVLIQMGDGTAICAYLQ